MKEDYTDCEDTTLTFQFAYQENEEDHFSGHISNLTLCIFNEATTLHAIHTLSENTLINGTRELTISVDPGNYYAVAWANTQQIPEMDTVTDFASLKQLADETKASLGKVYYAPDKRDLVGTNTDFNQYRVTAIQNKNTVHPLYFMGAYHTIWVHIEGWEDNVTPPEAVVSGLAAGYDYHLAPIKEPSLTFAKQTQRNETEEGVLLSAGFTVPHFDNENTITISVRSEIEALNKTISLEYFMTTEDITVSDGEMKVIELLFSYKNGVFTQVSLPRWNSIPTEGGFK